MFHQSYEISEISDEMIMINYYYYYTLKSVIDQQMGWCIRIDGIFFFLFAFSLNNHFIATRTTFECIHCYSQVSVITFIIEMN